MSSSTQVLPQPIRTDPRGIYAAFFIGSILTASLFGLTSIQAFIYFRTHAGRWTKFYRLIVLFLWILDATHTTLVVHCVYFYLVTNLAKIPTLREVVWSFRLQIVFNTCTRRFSSYFFATNAFDTTDAANLVGRDRARFFRIIPGIVIVSGSGVASFLIWVLYNHKIPTGMFLNRWTVFMAFGVATFLDVLITSSLWYLLASSRTGCSDICALTSITIVRFQSLYPPSRLSGHLQCAVMPYSFVFFTLQFLIAKHSSQVYVNSYIALLNVGYYTQSSNASPINSFELREPRRDSNDTNPGLDDLSQEKFPSFRRSMLAHPEVEVASPTRPLGAAMSVECKQLTFQVRCDDVGFEPGTSESSYRHTCGREMSCSVHIPPITGILVDALFVKASIHHYPEEVFIRIAKGEMRKGTGVL
ncbi:uncharacterized protein HD556DRAFT_1314721 [Suillus plorans]|uniref:Uncharacterized protein n=1 Tax=Suillus plorans TaxID=116603 RepID=A0A9P7A9L3_9AGAM|nr:uncharacterized protein HD556DRAFT_1314721 [Suillus plorans]KAG1784866.1 hypothetical protein HD556DRAFT_1314721 [Suillus plorans]